MTIDNKYKTNLFSYQIENTNNLIRIIQNNNAAFDGSDTGTGKTYTAVATCAQLKLKPIVVCPLAVMATWKKVCKIFDVKPFFIVNYETLKFGKYYDEKGKRKKCKYIKYDKEKNMYTWNYLKNEKVIFIFDEVHRCTNLTTYNGLLLISIKQTDKPVMILSATIADTPEKFKMFAYVLNFIDRDTVKNHKINFEQYMNIIEKWTERDDPMIRIHNMLYPDRGTRMRISAIPDFPETQITALPYNIDKKKEMDIEREYQKISDLLQELKEKKAKDKGNILVAVLRAHQKIELLKIPIFIDLTNDFIAQGKSVVIFVNFTDTLKTLAKSLKTDCLVWGGQTDTERQINLGNFQDNTERIMICNIKAGGVGISAHDLSGRHPRVSLLSPCWSSVDLVQALGRIHRAGGKTKSLQRIIYTANTIEEKIADKLQIKLKDLNSINNGDLDLTNIIFERRYQK
jgi:Mimiviridae putative ATP-dependent RNA helicase